jgi:uncharacterized protein with WD repeat
LLSKVTLEDVDKRDDKQFTDVDLRTVTLSPTGKHLAFIDRRGTLVEVWEPRANSWRKAFEVKFDVREGVNCLAFSPDGGTMIMGGLGVREGSRLDRHYPVILFWRIRGRIGEARPPLKDDGSYSIVRLAVSPDGRRLATLNANRIAIWDIPTSKRLIAWEFPSTTNDILFAPDGRHMTIANPNGTVYVLRIPEATPKP